MYVLLALIKILRHVLWRDELRAWMICRESVSLPGLLEALRFEGHPALWYLILYPLSRLTRDPIAMQLAHLFIAAAAVGVVARFAPFSRLQKVLFAFGYFPFFEYATLSRLYALGLLLAAMACTLVSRKRYGPVALGAVLALLSQTGIWGAILALSFAFASVLDAGLAGRERGPGWRPWPVAAGAVLLLSGFAVSLASIFPGPDRAFTAGWKQTPAAERFLATVTTLWRGYAPLPAPRVQFWNTNVLDGTPALMAGLSVAMFFSACWLCRRKPVALCLLTSASLGLLLFKLLVFEGFVRHAGHLFIAVLAAYWLAARKTGPVRPRLLGEAPAASPEGRYRSHALTALLSLQALAGVWASALDLAVPFSASRAAAEHIRRHFTGVPVVAHSDFMASAVSGHLDRPLYYPASGELGTIHRQDGTNWRPVSPDDIWRAAELFLDAGSDRVVVLLAPAQRLPDREFLVSDRAGRPRLDVRYVASFDRSIVPDETYTLYVVRRPAGGMADPAPPDVVGPGRPE